MTRILATIAIRVALWAMAAWGLWELGFGGGALLFVALLGIVLAKPLIELVIELWQSLRRAQWRQLEGRHYAYKGRPVRVEEDADHRRWVRLADIRAIAGFTASESALKVTYPSGWSLRGRPPSLHLGDEALLVHLTKERSPEGIRLRNWVEREIVFPARRQRERLGIPPVALDFRPSD